MVGFSGKSLADTWGSSAAVPFGQQVQSSFDAFMGRGGTQPAGAVARAPAADAGLAAGLTRSFNQANKANKDRFQKMIDLASQFGAAQTQQAEQLHQQNLGAIESNAVDRGLYNSTIVQGLKTSAGEGHQRRLTDIGERKANLELGILQQHEDRFPDLSLFAQLFSRPRAGGAQYSPSPLLSLFGG